MMQSDLRSPIATIADNPSLIGIPLLIGSIGLLCLHGKQPRYVYTLKLQPAPTNNNPRFVDFTSQQFEVGNSVEASHAVEMSNGKTLKFRPTQYPLTVSAKVAGVPLGKATIPVKVVEFWADGKKQGYFDFYHNKYVALGGLAPEGAIISLVQ
jgi:hypothetical protein